MSAEGSSFSVVVVARVVVLVVTPVVVAWLPEPPAAEAIVEGAGVDV